LDRFTVKVEPHNQRPEGGRIRRLKLSFDRLPNSSIPPVYRREREIRTLGVTQDAMRQVS
jgi:hypothetical protein